jgi:hypothetical protein
LSLINLPLTIFPSDSSLIILQDTCLLTLAPSMS